MKLAITRTDGVSIMDTLPDLAAGALAKWKILHGAKYVSHREISESDIPVDRTFRGAWKDSGSVIEHDMAKAREIHKDRLRALRAPKMAALDAAYLRADEAVDAAAKAAIVAQKQTLRDVTVDPLIEAAKTIEELKIAVPDALR